MDEQKINKEFEKLSNEINMQKIDRVSRISKFVSLFIIPILFFLFTYGAIRLNKLYKEIEDLETRKQLEQLKIKAFKFEYQSLEKKKVQLETELMATYGLSIDSITSLSTSQVLKISISANDAIKDIVEKYLPNNSVTISYYKKTIDEKRIVIELEALGYGFRERPPSEYMSMKETNAVWFGADVPIEDTKIVTLSMLRAGIPIKGIRPFRNSITNPQYKKNVIEIGASVDIENRNILTVDFVKNAKEFKR